MLTANAAMTAVEISGNQAGTAPTNGRGGGVFANASAIVSLVDSIVSYNGATAVLTNLDRGGGVFAGGGVNLTIESSRLSGNVARQGGGVYLTRGNAAAMSRPQVLVSNSLVENNVAYMAGGGLFSGPGVDLTLTCATVSGNQVVSGSGGGLYLDGPLSLNDINAQIIDSTIVSNSAMMNGGGVESRRGVELTVDNSIITQNDAGQRGGGFHLVGAGDVSSRNRTGISLSLISGNRAATPAGPYVAARAGGGIWAGGGASLEVGTTTIQNNQAGGTGGGIAVDGTNQFVLVNSTVSGNRAVDGAGVAVVQADATLLQNTWYANRANRDGGGMLVRSTTGHVVNVAHSTLSLNAAAFTGAGNGGGIFVDYVPSISPPVVRLDQTVVSGNLGAPLAGFDEVYDSGVSAGVNLVTARYSLLRDNAGTGFVPGNPDANGNLIGTPAAPIDAQLGPLGNNGGPTATMVPNNTSPVINAGDPLFTSPPQGDQRTSPYKRVVQMRIDIGAVEVQPPPPDADFNNDGMADCTDANALSAAIFSGANNPVFDLTGDGFVNYADMVKWLDDAPDINGVAITTYLPGDANLDGAVDGQDFIIWNLFKFTATVGWCSADFNIDGIVDGADFIIWNMNKFTVSPQPTGCGLFRDESGAAHDDGESAKDVKQGQPAASANLSRDVAFADLDAEGSTEFAPNLAVRSPFGEQVRDAVARRSSAEESRWHNLLSTIFEEG